MDLTRTAIAMTAWRRPQYLRQTLASWAQVDGIRDVAAFSIHLDPSERLDKMLAVIAEARGEYGLDITARVNTRHLGVSVNPVESGTAVFREHPDVDFIVMAEEDLVVADDTLRYLTWADETFRDTPGVLIACAHSPDNPDPDADPAAVVLLPRFRCWIWGTWRDRWFNTLAPSWDRNYSTGTPEHPEVGFDYNIDLRVIPQGRLRVRAAARVPVTEHRPVRGCARRREHVRRHAEPVVPGDGSGTWTTGSPARLPSPSILSTTPPVSRLA